MGPDAVCPSCKELIDAQVCWCGDFMDARWQGTEHTHVPMGCRCYFDDGTFQERYETYLNSIGECV